MVDSTPSQGQDTVGITKAHAKAPGPGQIVLTILRPGGHAPKKGSLVVKSAILFGPFPTFSEWCTNFGDYHRARGGARKTIAAEDSVCTILGTLHSHQSVYCEQPERLPFFGA